MDKRVDGLAGAMREIADARDNRLRKAEAISPQRLEGLQSFLAAQFPVETALNAAARQRDESLSVAEPALSLAVHAALLDQVRFVRSATSPLEVLRSFLAWVQTLSLRRAYQTTALVAVAIIITVAALHFLHSSTPADGIVNRSRLTSLEDRDSALLSRDWLFEPSGDHLTLRGNRLEFASLEPSFLTLNRELPTLEQPDRVLFLDLPIRQIRLDVEALRTP